MICVEVLKMTSAEINRSLTDMLYKSNFHFMRSPDTQHTCPCCQSWTKEEMGSLSTDFPTYFPTKLNFFDFLFSSLF